MADSSATLAQAREITRDYDAALSRTLSPEAVALLAALDSAKENNRNVSRETLLGALSVTLPAVPSVAELQNSDAAARQAALARLAAGSNVLRRLLVSSEDESKRCCGADCGGGDAAEEVDAAEPEPEPEADTDADKASGEDYAHGAVVNKSGNAKSNSGEFIATLEGDDCGCDSDADVALATTASAATITSSCASVSSTAAITLRVLRFLRRPYLAYVNNVAGIAATIAALVPALNSAVPVEAALAANALRNLLAVTPARHSARFARAAAPALEQAVHTVPLGNPVLLRMTAAALALALRNSTYAAVAAFVKNSPIFVDVPELWGIGGKRPNRMLGETSDEDEDDNTFVKFDGTEADIAIPAFVPDGVTGAPRDDDVPLLPKSFDNCIEQKLLRRLDTALSTLPCTDAMFAGAVAELAALAVDCAESVHTDKSWAAELVEKRAISAHYAALRTTASFMALARMPARILAAMTGEGATTSRNNSALDVFAKYIGAIERAVVALGHALPLEPTQRTRALLFDSFSAMPWESRPEMTMAWPQAAAAALTAVRSAASAPLAESVGSLQRSAVESLRKHNVADDDGANVVVETALEVVTTAALALESVESLVDVPVFEDALSVVTSLMRTMVGPIYSFEIAKSDAEGSTEEKAAEEDGEIAPNNSVAPAFPVLCAAVARAVPLAVARLLQSALSTRSPTAAVGLLTALTQIAKQPTLFATFRDAAEGAAESSSLFAVLTKLSQRDDGFVNIMAADLLQTGSGASN